MSEAKRILVLAGTADETAAVRGAAEKLALEVVLGCADESGTMKLDFARRDSALHVLEYVHKNPVAAIVPVGDGTGPSAARAASMIGIAFHPPKAADACANKASLRRRLQGAGLAVSENPQVSFANLGHRAVSDAPGITLECVMTGGKLRVLAVVDENSHPSTFASMSKERQGRCVEVLRKIGAVVGMKHGPVRVDFSSELSVADVSLTCSPKSTDRLRFRIPLVDEDVSLQELLLRHALDLDISRAHLVAKT